MAFRHASVALVALCAVPLLTEGSSTSRSRCESLSRPTVTHGMVESVKLHCEVDKAVKFIQEQIDARTALNVCEESACTTCEDLHDETCIDHNPAQPVILGETARWKPPAISERPELIEHIVADAWRPDQDHAGCSFSARSSTSWSTFSAQSGTTAGTVLSVTISPWATVPTQQQQSSVAKVTTTAVPTLQPSGGAILFPGFSEDSRKVNESTRSQEASLSTTRLQSSTLVAAANIPSLFAASSAQQPVTNVLHSSLWQHLEEQSNLESHLPSATLSNQISPTSVARSKPQLLAATTSLKQLRPIDTLSESTIASPTSTSTDFITTTGTLTITSVHRTTASPSRTNPISSKSSDGDATYELDESGSRFRHDASELPKLTAKMTGVPAQTTQNDVSNGPHKDSAGEIQSSSFAFSVAVLVWLLVQA